ncbi:hypothetical protein BAC2_01111 [uncultured bacterium]|nr:hypothetical protein BAC2_01111 [uncultured bacterium]
MEIIIITSIVVAVFGAVALAWVLSQGGTPGDTPQAEGTANADEPEMAAGTAAAAETAETAAEAMTNPAAGGQPAAPSRPEPAPSRTAPMPPSSVRPRTSAPERSGFDGIAAFAAAEADQVVPPIENIPTPKSSQPDSGSGMALNTRPGVELAVPGHPLRLNAIDLIASQIEILYEEYVRLDEERSRLAQELLTNMLFEKIERTAGRLEIVTEQTTLDLRKELIKVSAEYDRVQFRLGSLQHLNARLGDPRVAHQIEELVVTVRALAGDR